MRHIIIYFGTYHDVTTIPLPPSTYTAGLNTALDFSRVTQGRHTYEVVITDSNSLTVRNQLSFESKIYIYIYIFPQHHLVPCTTQASLSMIRNSCTFIPLSFPLFLLFIYHLSLPSSLPPYITDQLTITCRGSLNLGYGIYAVVCDSDRILSYTCTIDGVLVTCEYYCAQQILQWSLHVYI